jgi:hypothetical protein
MHLKNCGVHHLQPEATAAPQITNVTLITTYHRDACALRRLISSNRTASRNPLANR